MTATPSESLQQLRERLDLVDTELVDVLARRFVITREIGELKATSKLPPKDAVREAVKKIHLRELAEDVGLDPDVVQRVYELIVNEVLIEHRMIARGEPVPKVSEPAE